MQTLKKACLSLKKAAEEGVDRKSAFGPARKVQEELEEIKEELSKPPSPERHAALEEEIGDLFLASCCLARHCNVDPEEAISVALEKFNMRYAALKIYMQNQGQTFETMTTKEVISLWKKVKTHK